MTLVERLEKIGACPAALEWVRTLPRDVTLSEAWEQCPRADWLLWLAGKVVREHGSLLHRQVVCAAAACAATVYDTVAMYVAARDIAAIVRTHVDVALVEKGLG